VNYNFFKKNSHKIVQEQVFKKNKKRPTQIRSSYCKKISARSNVISSLARESFLHFLDLGTSENH